MLFFSFLLAVLYSSVLLRLPNFSSKQEQGIAAEIVQVVIAGNLVEIPHGLLNGQVNLCEIFYHLVLTGVIFHVCLLSSKAGSIVK